MTSIDSATVAELSIDPTSSHALDHRVFGQFLERPSRGEHGPECDGALDPEQHRLRSELMAQIRRLGPPPVIRFPGGADVDSMDWHDLIDDAPGRVTAERPVRSFGPMVTEMDCNRV